MSDIGHSYPFLQIAKKHDVNYGYVLTIADTYRKCNPETRVENLTRALVEEFPFVADAEGLTADIEEATVGFQRVQQGLDPYPSA